MKKFLPAFFFAAASLTASAQAPTPNYTFFNSGDSVFIEPGGLLYVGMDDNTGDYGDIVLRADSTGIHSDGIFNDGIIAVSGNLYSGGTVGNKNFGNPVFKPSDHFNTGYKERMVSFIGLDNDQYIKGLFDQPEASFYNLAIDKVWDINASPRVIMQSNIRVNGSLMWDPKNTVNSSFDFNQSTLMSSATYPDFLEGEAPIQTYTGTQDYEIYVTNPAIDAITGYTPLVGGAKTLRNTIVNRGAQGIGIGGLAREVNSANYGNDYVFPIGTNTAGYNPIAMNFDQIPTGVSKKIRGLYANGNVGTVDYSYYGTLTCNSEPQWFIFDEFFGDGYWSFDAQDNGTDYQYSVMAYPSVYNPGSEFTNRRILKYSSPIDDVPGDDMWTNQVANDYNPNDLNQIFSDYTSFSSAGPCFNDPSFGVPGGPYSGFSHFQMGGSGSNGLPVELISLKAYPVNNEFIQVAWATATEINNEKFEVLRSQDGLNFSKIGEVGGSGTTTEIRNYSFDDKNVLPNVTYYYRLNQVDFDGKAELTNIVSAAITGSSDVVISDFIPNPTRSASKLFITSPTDIKLDVSMFNALGQEIQSSSIELPAGVQTPFAVDGHILAAGNYVFVLHNENMHVSRRLTITAH